MIDTLLANLDRFDPGAGRARFGLTGDYAVATVHRPANVDDPVAAARIVAAFRERRRAAAGRPAAPSPRTGHARGGRARLVERVVVVEPLGYVEFLGADPRRARRDHRLGRDPGGDDGPRDPVPDDAPEHRAADHDQPGHEPAGRAGRGRPGGSRASSPGPCHAPGTGRRCGTATRRADRRDPRGEVRPSGQPGLNRYPVRRHGPPAGARTEDP